MSEIQTTAATLTEKPMWIRIGFFFFKVCPLTLAQIWEIGAKLEGVEELNIKDSKNNVVTELFINYNLLPSSLDIIMLIIFRKKWKRILFGRYIKNRLTMSHYKKIMEFALVSFQAGFFLTSFTFLKGIKTMTNPTNTNEATHLGDSSEE